MLTSHRTPPFSCACQWLTLKKPTLDVAARLFPPVQLGGLPAHCSLLEVLNEQGIFVAAGSTSACLRPLLLLALPGAPRVGC